MSFIDDVPFESGLPWIFQLGRSRNEILWHSEKARATIQTLMMASGFGALPQGTVLSKNKSAAGNTEKLMPYAPTVFTNAATNAWSGFGRMFFFEDGVSGANTIKISLADSYKLVEGDELIIDDTVTAPEDLGAITDIDRGMAFATITVTNAIGGTDFTVEQLAHVRIKAGISTPWSDAFGITSIFTDGGSGQYINQPLPTAVIMRGADLYTNKGTLGNLDDAAVTGLNGRISENLFIF